MRQPPKRCNNEGYASGLERDNGKVLERALKRGDIKDFWYETGPCVIHYTKPLRGGKCTECDSSKVHSNHLYTADFAYETLEGVIVLVECKGHYLAWTGSTRSKHQLIKKQLPDIELRFVFNNKNAQISKSSKTTNAQWCKRQGFLCESALIPRRWFNED